MNRGEPASTRIPRRSNLPPLLLCFIPALCVGLPVEAGDPNRTALWAVETNLRQGCGCDSSRVVWSAGSGLSALVEGLRELEVDLEPGPGDAARHTVHLSGSRDGRRVRFSLTAELQCLGPHLRAARALAAGARVAPTDLEVAEGWHSPAALAPENWSQPELHAPRGFAAHRELLPGDLVAPPLVRRAQAVALVYRSAGLELRGTGLARRDGWFGDHVSVRLDGATRDCEGVVTGPGQVSVAPGAMASASQGG